MCCSVMNKISYAIIDMYIIRVWEERITVTGRNLFVSSNISGGGGGEGGCDGRPVAYILMGEGLYHSSSMPFCTDMPSFQGTSLSIPWMMMAYHLCILPLGCVRLTYHIRHAGSLPPVSTGLPVMPTESTKPM